mmetsp:Transcript_53657/g.89010  ORF Transcript_53657/g.89010 Transcript_53657/m.89010 type:complete len:258 (-) Transcript_53657:2267-3040(-)
MRKQQQRSRQWLSQCGLAFLLNRSGIQQHVHRRRRRLHQLVTIQQWHAQFIRSAHHHHRRRCRTCQCEHHTIRTRRTVRTSRTFALQSKPQLMLLLFLLLFLHSFVASLQYGFGCILRFGQQQQRARASIEFLAFRVMTHWQLWHCILLFIRVGNLEAIVLVCLFIIIVVVVIIRVFALFVVFFFYLFVDRNGIVFIVEKLSDEIDELELNLLHLRRNLSGKLHLGRLVRSRLVVLGVIMPTSGGALRVATNALQCW